MRPILHIVCRVSCVAQYLFTMHMLCSSCSIAYQAHMWLINDFCFTLFQLQVAKFKRCDLSFWEQSTISHMLRIRCQVWNICVYEEKKNCLLTFNTNISMEFQSLSYPQRRCTTMYGEVSPIIILLFLWKRNEKKMKNIFTKKKKN